MREIQVSQITETIAQLSQQANFDLPEDVLEALKKARSKEEAPRAQKVLDMIVKNSEIAHEKQIALCQDTGTTVLFLELGQDVHLVGGDLYEALAEGVRLGYKQGFLRNSIVNQPFSARINHSAKRRWMREYEQIINNEASRWKTRHYRFRIKSD